MKSFVQKKVNAFKNEWPRYTVLLVWILINLISFIVVFFQYKNSLAYFYLRQIVQNGLSWSRASAFCLNLNCSMLLLLVCRNFISYTRYFLCLPTNVVRILDKHVSFHRHVGYLVIFFTIIHTLGHIHNVEQFVVGQNIADSAASSANATSQLNGLISTLSALPTTADGSYVNPVRSAHSVPIVETLKLVAGVTGVALCLTLAVLYTTSVAYMRRAFYNLFWYVHQLGAALFLTLCCVHGLQGVVRHQTNLDANEPARCYAVWADWSTQSRTCAIPQFAGSPATTWRWLVVPVCIYALERLVRFLRSLRRHEIAAHVLHPSGVLELRIRNGSDAPHRIKYRAGQYVYLNVAAISLLEWHPFTITSAPSDEYLSVHIRNAGDWTSKLIEQMAASSAHDVISGNRNAEQRRTEGASSALPRIRHQISIDGPYGTCAEDVFKYERVVLIGAGIGVTPYASVLKHVWHTLGGGGGRDLLLSKVHFFWICPSLDTFEWFGQLLQSLEAEMHRQRCFQLLDYHLYLTRGWSLREARRIASNHADSYDLFTGLRQKTNYGRPNFDVFFKELAASAAAVSPTTAAPAPAPAAATAKRTDVGVFFCGPAQLSAELHMLCDKHSNVSVRFFYNKETF